MSFIIDTLLKPEKCEYLYRLLRWWYQDMHNVSQGILSLNLKFQGIIQGIHLKPELSGKFFTWNQRILWRDSTLRCILPDLTFMIHTKFFQASGFKENVSARRLIYRVNSTSTICCQLNLMYTIIFYRFRGCDSTWSCLQDFI